MSNYFVVYDENGQDGDPKHLKRDAANKALDCMNKKGDDQGNKVTVRIADPNWLETKNQCGLGFGLGSGCR